MQLVFKYFFYFSLLKYYDKQYVLYIAIQLVVALVPAHVDLVQALIALVQTHPSQGGLIWLVRRQVVVGPGSGLVVSV